MTILKDMNELNWVEVCALDDITPNTGVGALIENQQIALFRVGHEKRVYALSNQDPFSKAFVMSRGILGDLQGERVVASPIYKQHFSLATGRCLEDKDQKLLVFPSKIENGKVWISPTPQKTYITNNGISQEKMKLVLVGNGLAGMRCLEDLLDMAPDRYEITVIGEEPWGNYNRIMLSPVLSGEKTIDDIMLHPHAWYADKGIRLFAGDLAVRIDRPRKHVYTEKGEVISYDRLILATGSKPFVPPIPGSDLKGVLSFRDIYDVNSMLDYCKTWKNAVVIGGGLLGLEAAYGLKQQGMNVTVLHLMDRIMDRQLDSKASQMLKTAIEQKGITILTAANTEGLIGEEGHVTQVKLKNGTVLDADLVVFAVGIRPNMTLAQSAGLRCNRGVLVNDTMQTFDPSIYAVGECIEHRGQTFGLVEPLWGQAFICASHLAEHGSLTFKAPTVPTQLKVSGCDVFSAGDFEPKEDFEDIVLNDEKRQIYKRIIIQKDRVIGAVLFGDTEDGAWYAELIADQTPITSIRNKLLFGRDFALKKAG
ncbi:MULTISPECIES: nitrite reductase small subunit NirD [Acinetobacter]|uniref:Nitrite reductase [NAD(P)H], large subunit n=1 Tax=Acinetobacter parvus DSM 16617 = CIP 108168 TaxID=981333 RepID=N8RM59_9GAMM|nr:MULTISPECIES: nitrite reductase small subunit NirD [Acinetobacter]ENU36478.1 nitrite reductase [NAD(P)H], large subunit [Acinetobacter parvus DSM 16617 = CIP 108168]ENU82424.1 nitrite reductase [NAD(P)H], large subunit [Acinetobacter sp. CIP 102159]ENU89455.1 nitrite reductase [NAD(P)H], large subunit [Acinetobacter sp. CIP 102529]ENU96663.1 nitrite reductase [NAD(P)H], large subunit [Acinetobacter sp. CIP 102082]ENX63965.1 nitrite reductase [NAD(P)H], large subunit [Acinetobacter sp. CIP 1